MSVAHIFQCVHTSLQSMCAKHPVCVCVGLRSGYSFQVRKLVFPLRVHLHLRLRVHMCFSGSERRVSPTLVCVEVMLSTLPTL